MSMTRARLNNSKSAAELERNFFDDKQQTATLSPFLSIKLERSRFSQGGECTLYMGEGDEGAKSKIVDVPDDVKERWRAKYDADAALTAEGRPGKGKPIATGIKRSVDKGIAEGQRLVTEKRMAEINAATTPTPDTQEVIEP
jgi:hypothetical protein